MRSVRLLQPQAELPPCGLRLVYRRSSGPVWGYLFPSTGQRRGFQYSSSRNDAPFWPYTSNKAPPQVAWWCMPAVDAPPCIFNNPLAAAPPMADCAYNWDFSLPLSAIGGESQCGHVQSPLFGFTAAAALRQVDGRPRADSDETLRLRDEVARQEKEADWLAEQSATRRQYNSEGIRE